tara:strand:- start:333 stop:608 length:276 start_codon:yes stop_codon:yes gene_type:complete
MKYILLAILLLFSCDRESTEVTKANVLKLHGVSINEFTFEDCDYLYLKDGYRFGITHKGNCKNPIHYKNIVTVNDTVTYKLILDDEQNKTD